VVDPVGVRPVGFDGDRAEPPLADQSLGDLCPDSIKLVGAVRRFADEDVPSIADQREEGIEVARRAV
jgi:hypothetical protein